MIDFRKGSFKYAFGLSPEDLRNEKLIMEVFIKHIGDSFVAQKIEEAVEGYVCGKKIDYRIIDFSDPSFIGYGEVKRRHLSYKRMVGLGGLFLSKKKYELLKEKIDVARCVYVAGLNDVIGYQSINDDEIVKEYIGGGGATNRNSQDDYEPMVVFNPEHFKIITRNISYK